MVRKLIALGVLFVAIVGVTVWFYMTPYLALNAMRSAAVRGDATALSDYVDFPAVRASLKAGVGKKTTALAAAVPPNPLVALGMQFASALAETAVDWLVTPQSLALILSGVQPQPGAAPAPPPASSVETSEHYEDFSTFSVTVQALSVPSVPIGLVLTRRGLASWQLTEVRLP